MLKSYSTMIPTATNCIHSTCWRGYCRFVSLNKSVQAPSDPAGLFREKSPKWDGAGQAQRVLAFPGADRQIKHQGLRKYPLFTWQKGWWLKIRPNDLWGLFQIKWSCDSMNHCFLFHPLQFHVCYLLKRKLNFPKKQHAEQSSIFMKIMALQA